MLVQATVMPLAVELRLCVCVCVSVVTSKEQNNDTPRLRPGGAVLAPEGAVLALAPGEAVLAFVLEGGGARPCVCVCDSN